MSTDIAKVLALIIGTLYFFAPFGPLASEVQPYQGGAEASEPAPHFQKREAAMERLVILATEAAPAAERAVAELGHVVQAASARVLVVNFPSEQAAERAAQIEGVRFIGPDAPSERATFALSEADELFIAAWTQARKGKGERIGEGLEWDDPRMIPPDPPQD